MDGSPGLTLDREKQAARPCSAYHERLPHIPVPLMVCRREPSCKEGGGVRGRKEGQEDQRVLTWRAQMLTHPEAHAEANRRAEGLKARAQTEAM